MAYESFSDYDNEINKFISKNKRWNTDKHNWKICFNIIRKYAFPLSPRGYSSLELCIKIKQGFFEQLNDIEKAFVVGVIGGYDTKKK